MPVTTFDYYRQRSRRKAGAEPRATASGLVKVNLKATPMEGQSFFSLVLANGRRIESGWSFSDTDLARLIRVAEAV